MSDYIEDASEKLKGLMMGHLPDGQLKIILNEVQNSMSGGKRKELLDLLKYFIREGKFKELKKLIKFNLNLYDGVWVYLFCESFGQTLLKLAVLNDNLDILKWLLEKRLSNIYYPLEKEKALRYQSYGVCDDNKYRTVFNVAVKYNKPQIWKWLLSNKLMDMSRIDKYGFNIINNASRKGNIDVLKYLHSEGYINVYNKSDMIHYSSGNNHLSILKWANKEGFMEFNAHNNSTLVLLAIKYNNLEMIKWLYETIFYDSDLGKNIPIKFVNIVKEYCYHSTTDILDLTVAL